MDSHERHERVAQEAGEWLLRLSSADMARSERIEYVSWLRESPVHVAEMLRVTGAHRRLTEFEGWSEIPPADPSSLGSEVYELPLAQFPSDTSAPHRGGVESKRESNGHTRWRTWSLWTVLATAASVAVLIVASTYFGLFGPHTIVADAGQRREVTLPDGTRVRLSPRSHLAVHFTSRQRDVVLADGDALFTVAKDSTKPFIVQTGRTRVRAVGTVFGVEHDDGSIIVTVEEGRVAVAESVETSTQTHSSGEPALQSVAVTEISLGANQQIIVPPAGPLSAIRQVDSRRELSWAEGRLVVDNESVADVVRQFNRFNRVQIKVTDPALAARSVTAVFDATDPEAFITFLESVADVRVTRSSSNEILITSEGPR